MMVHFRKRFPVEDLARINEYIGTGVWPEEIRNVDRNDEIINETESNTDGENGNNDAKGSNSTDDGKDAEKPSTGQTAKGKKNRNTSKKKEKHRKKEKTEYKHKGKLVVDATVAPSDIKYPTDINLLNQCREHLETAISILWEKAPHTGHKLPYSHKKARKSFLSLSKSKKWTKAKCRSAIADQLRYIELANNKLKELQSKINDYASLYPKYLRDRLSVIPTVYQQQKQMYDNNTNICENRICSLQQSFVRPIKRGKRPNPTEFGQKLHLSVVEGYTFFEQTSWSNFNEALDLKATVEDYFRATPHNSARAAGERKWVLMKALFRSCTLCTARKSDKIRAHFIRQMPQTNCAVVP